MGVGFGGFAAGFTGRGLLADFGKFLFKTFDFGFCIGNLFVDIRFFHFLFQCGKVVFDGFHICVRGCTGIRKTLFNVCLAFLKTLALTEKVSKRTLCFFKHEIDTELFQHFSFSNLSLIFFTVASRLRV